MRLSGVDGDEPEDAIPAALRSARPAHDDIAAAVARARVARTLFGEAAPVRIGRYEVESKAGAGGGGEVFVARDPELSRRVAIKLVRAGGDRDRMLAEGHALARLSHPNIVPVYDAGTLDDQIYVVMELVEGDTLRAYCDANDRSVREIVRAYRQAAEGLDAAHRAGFIHRDFKPDNALVGRDGRVRVVDFGLARGGIENGGPEPVESASPVAVTHAGLGTPRYMAPEQAAAVQLTAAVDQYAFCASLREGLLARGPLPRWLEAIVRRGMATDPAARYASMAGLHAALGRDPASRWRVRAVAGGVLALAAAAFVIGRSDRATAPACDRGSAELAAQWDAATPARIAGHLATLATPYARQSTTHINATLEAYAARWRAGDHDACLAHHAGVQSTAMFDRRVACLARARAALGTAVRLVTSATGDQLADAVGAIGQLPDLERCADPGALTTPVAPPAPGIAAAVTVLANELAALEVEVAAARPDVRPRIDDLIPRARALGYPPLVARALALAGRAALSVYALRDTIPPYEEATALALTAGDHALAVEAFAARMYAAAMIDPAAASAGAELMQAIAAGLPPSEIAARAYLDNTFGSAALASGRRDDARVAFERALRSARELTGSARVALAGTWTNLALVLDDPARRIALARERIAILEAGLGAGHPRSLEARITAAHLETDRGRARALLQPPCAQLVELQPEHGFEILECQFQLGWLAFERGDLDDARRAFGRAVAADGHGARGHQLGFARAYLALLAGRFTEATTLLDDEAEGLGSLQDAAWWAVADAADLMIVRGALARTARRERAARAAFEAARASLETVVAVAPLPRNLRRLAFVQASLARAWPGPLPPAARREATAALAWYRSAGGYDDAITELEHALAR